MSYNILSEVGDDIRIFFMHFCPGAMPTHAESINSDLQRVLERRLRHTQHWTHNRIIFEMINGFQF